MTNVYLNHAATSFPKPRAVMEAVVRWFEQPPVDAARGGDAGCDPVTPCRQQFAQLLGVTDPGRVVLLPSATHALNLVVAGLAAPGSHVVTSVLEHNSLLRPLAHRERDHGVAVSYLGVDEEGMIDPGQLVRALRPHTSLVALCHASNVTGTILPIDALAKIAREREILFIVDAAQTAGCLPIDVIRTGVDVLCFTGHKSLLGPQGTGGFYIRKGLENILPPLMRGGTGSASESEEQPDFLPDKFESGTPNAIGLAGLGAGIRFVIDTGIEHIREKEVRLTRRFLEGAARLPGITIYGPCEAAHRTAVVSFNLNGFTPSDLASGLDEEFGLLSRPGLHCSPAAHRTIGTFPQGTLRFSFGFFNTEAEIQTGLEALAYLSRKYHNKKRR